MAQHLRRNDTYWPRLEHLPTIFKHLVHVETRRAGDDESIRVRHVDGVKNPVETFGQGVVVLQRVGLPCVDVTVRAPRQIQITTSIRRVLWCWWSTSSSCGASSDTSRGVGMVVRLRMSVDFNHDGNVAVMVVLAVFRWEMMTKRKYFLIFVVAALRIIFSVAQK